MRESNPLGVGGSHEPSQSAKPESAGWSRLVCAPGVHRGHALVRSLNYRVSGKSPPSPIVNWMSGARIHGRSKLVRSASKSKSLVSSVSERPCWWPNVLSCRHPVTCLAAVRVDAPIDPVAPSASAAVILSGINVGRSSAQSAGIRETHGARAASGTTA
jgi:hypothetical protein